MAARLRQAVTTLVITSAIAGLATAPFAAYHFQRVAPLTLVANLLAMPVVGTLVMPMALFAVVLMPFGLEALPLTVMGWGLDWVTQVARTTAAWSAGYGGVSAMPLAALGLIVAGFLWLTLWRNRWRLAGLAPVLLAIPVALTAPHPDVLIDEDGMTAAVRGAGGHLAIVNGKGQGFVVENWLRADGDTRGEDAADIAAGVACDPLGCVAPLGEGGARVAVAARAAAMEEDCREATVVVARFTAPTDCAAPVVIDRRALARHGAHALYRTGTDDDGRPRFRVETAYPENRRPFMPPATAQ
jgi:competence protein ComEC